MDIQDTQRELEKIKTDAEAALSKLKELDTSMKLQEENLKYASNVVSKKLGEVVEPDKFIAFFKRPFTVISYGKNKVLVAVPKFIRGFQVGWLWKEDETFFIYQLDQYSAWLGDVPTELLEEIQFRKQLDGIVQGNVVFFEPSQKDIIKKKLGVHLKDISDTQATIVRGHSFDVIAEMIESGSLPFKPIKVDASDMRPQRSKIELRAYQKVAVNKFLETGATGVFHPTGAGKSIISLYLIDIIKGKKIIVVPTRTLLEQWAYLIETYIPHAKDEVKLITYQGYRESDDEYMLAIFDECQRLPADTFSRLSVIKTKYRLGLSASPHREDGREAYIFALTGFPVGLNWKEYMETVGRKYHPVFVHVVKSKSGKFSKLDSLIDFTKKTLIFCDTIELGKEIANKYNIPYIFGQTKDRLHEIQNNKVLVVSRVMDLGVSIKDLERIIEVDFLFGSRGQELQRTGRLMHSEADEAHIRHDIVMTEKEISSYGKRLWALQEKGFTVKVLGS